MGFMSDYFRAPDVAAVLNQMAQRDGGPLVSENGDSSAFDGVELKGVDPPVALGRLALSARRERTQIPSRGGHRCVIVAGCLNRSCAPPVS